MNHEIEASYLAAAQAKLPDAKCLPFALYADAAAYQLEQRTIFHSDWVFVCAERQLPNPGDYVALTLADEPVVVVRGGDGELRALSNVCQHRGTLLNDEGHGKAKRMVCPYHAWTYETDGRLIGVPHADDAEVDKAAHCLPRFGLEVWQGLVFVSLASQPSALGDRYAGIERYLSLYQYPQFDTYYPGVTESWQCNWKLAMENAMESYHLFKVHKNTLETAAPTKQAFYLEGGAQWSLTGGKYQFAGGKVTRWLLGTGTTADQHYVLISLPPAFVGILSRESLTWVSVYPSGTASCQVQSGALSAKGGSTGEEDAFAAAFLAEDKMICERAQRGMGATHSRGGSLVAMERVVVDFHNYLASRIAGATERAVFQPSDNVFFPS